MTKYILLIFFLGLAPFIYGQDFFSSYSASSIPDSMTKNAHSVYRLDEAVLDISSPSHYTYQVHQIVTIMNAEGAGHLRQALSFDKFNGVESVSIGVYNKLGLLVKKYSKKDFEVQAAYDGISLMTDDKVMHLSLAAPEYPCTVDVAYTRSANGYIELPDWFLTNINTSVETFRYVITVPTDLGIRYRPINWKLAPIIKELDKKKQYTWEAKNIPATKLQKGGFGMYYYVPQIQVAPNAFEYDHYSGNFSDWNAFGKWNYQLYDEKNPFSKQRTAEIQQLVANETNVNEKVRILYDYLKNNVRYVSIQLGIGGFKPFPAKFVDEKKYGDCKALSNYMRSLLTVVGINSYPALINAGYDEAPVDPNFPSDPFNHVILCVPTKADTIWLECTSNHNEPGFLGSFTENRNALLLTENGGVLVRTPASRYQKNRSVSRTEVFINEDGGAKSVTKLWSSGDIASDFHYIKGMDHDEQKEIFVHALHYATPDQFSLEPGKDENVLNASFEFERLYDFNAGSKFFFPQKLCRLFNDNLNEEERKIEYIFEYPFEKSDTTIYHLPKVFTVDELPAAKELQNDFLTYSKKAVYNKEDGTLQTITVLAIKKNIIAPADYTTVFRSLKIVQQDEGEKIILKHD